MATPARVASSEVSNIVGTVPRVALIETTLTLPDSVQPKFCRLTLNGRRLIRASWTGARRLRESVKNLDVQNESDAKHAFDRARDQLMRKGYCRVIDAASAARGDTVLEVLVPNRCPADVFDIAPDGRTLVIGTMLADAYGAEIHLVDISTGQRRLIHAEPPEIRPTGKGQTFLHAVLFHADGERIVYALNGETRLLDPATGQQRALAVYRQWTDAAFNPFCVRPLWNGDRSRLLVFDAGDMVRVLDANGSPLWELSTTDSWTECRAGTLSPSGRLAAVYRASRGVIYHHSDALHDTTNQIEVWDIAAGRLITQLPAPVDGQAVHRIGFDPTERLIVTNPFPARGPCALSVDTGELAWHFPDKYRTDRWDVCFAWAHSPDGATLAIGRGGTVDVVDAGTHVADPAFDQRLTRWPQRARPAVRKVSSSRPTERCWSTGAIPAVS